MLYVQEMSFQFGVNELVYSPKNGLDDDDGDDDDDDDDDDNDNDGDDDDNNNNNNNLYRTFND